MVASGLGPTEPSVLEPLPAEGTPVFFAVSILKFIVLSIFSLGVYDIYWFYKNWKLARAREDSDILPS